MVQVMQMQLNPFSDIDECSVGTDNCDTNAACTNAPGSFTCTCNQGYVGNGVTCIGNYCSSDLERNGEKFFVTVVVSVNLSFHPQGRSLYLYERNYLVAGVVDISP